MGLAAIGAGAALAMGGATAVGAVGAAVVAGTTAALSIGTVFTAIATVGAVVGAVGAVANISELKTAGMVLGGIGGVGSLASAVGAFGDAATVGSIFGSGGGAAGVDGATGMINGGFNQVSDAADDILGAGAFDGSAASGALDAATGLPVNSMNSMDIISAANKIAGSTPLDPNDIVEGPSGTNVVAGAGSDAQKQVLSNTSKPVAAPQTDITEGPSGPSGLGSVAKSTNTGANVTGTVGGPPKNATLGDEWTNPTTGNNYSYNGQQWITKPSFWGSSSGAMLGMGVLQSAGSFLSGATDELKPAQVNAYNAQAAANNAQAGLANKELSNMNSNIPVARRINVTGQPGMINR